MFLLSFYKQQNLQMGCVASSTNANIPDHAQIDTKVGKITITLKNIKFNKELARNIKHNIFGKLTLSHISKNTELYSVRSLSNPIDEKFEFCINSCYKIHGRVLTVEIFERNSNIQNELCSGLIDLDPFLAGQIQKEPYTKTYLYNGNNVLGSCQFNIKFQQYCHTNLYIRINSLFLRKNMVSENLYSVRIVAGQEIIQTRPKKCSTECIPSWKNQIIKIKVPQFIEIIKMEIICQTDFQEIHGEIQVSNRQLNSLEGQILFNRHVMSNGRIIGNIIFDTVLSDENFNAFQQHPSSYRADEHQYSCNKGFIQTCSSIKANSPKKNETMKSQTSLMNKLNPEAIQ